MERIESKSAPAAIGPYSQAYKANGLLFTSGQIPMNPETGKLEGETIESQTEQVMKNLGAILKEAGVGFEDVVKTTCFLSDIANFAAFNEIYAKYFTGKPARSCFAVKALPAGALVEVEAIAEL